MGEVACSGIYRSDIRDDVARLNTKLVTTWDRGVNTSIDVHIRYHEKKIKGRVLILVPIGSNKLASKMVFLC